LISGELCAIAGEATAVAAAPAADTFKKSRRFIKTSPCSGIFHGIKKKGSSGRRFNRIQPKALGSRLSTAARLAKRNKGMTALNKSRR
jgi:hypothetical protein